MSNDELELAVRELLEIYDLSVGRIKTLEETVENFECGTINMYNALDGRIKELEAKVEYLDDALEFLSQKLLKVHEAGVQEDDEANANKWAKDNEDALHEQLDGVS
jgi:hypothetical protein